MLNTIGRWIAMDMRAAILPLERNIKGSNYQIALTTTHLWMVELLAAFSLRIVLSFCRCLLLVCVLYVQEGGMLWTPEDLCLRTLTLIERPVCLVMTSCT